jgi:CRP/FNR family transcriptional regulator, cyclic AMP receptor protein
MPQSAAAARVAGACTWYIRHVDLFRRLSERDASDLTRAMTPRRFKAGQLIGGPAGEDCVYVTRSGRVRLFQRADNGHEVTVDRLDPGHLFGVTALLGSQARLSMLAQAETDVEVCVVQERIFLDIVARWPKALLELAVRLGVRVLPSEDSIGRVSARGARARLARVLYELAREANEKQPGGGVRLRGVPRHSDLATTIGASRETVTRMLGRLEEDGYIRRYGRQIVVPDLKRVIDDFDLDTFG